MCVDNYKIKRDKQYSISFHQVILKHKCSLVKYQRFIFLLLVV